MIIVFCHRQQERIAQEREEIERQRKVLGKRKPNAASGSSGSGKANKNTKENDGFLRPNDKPSTYDFSISSIMTHLSLRVNLAPHIDRYNMSVCALVFYWLLPEIWKLNSSACFVQVKCRRILRTRRDNEVKAGCSQEGGHRPSGGARKTGAGEEYPHQGAEEDTQWRCFKVAITFPF